FNDSNNTSTVIVNNLAVTNIITNPGFEVDANGTQPPTGWNRLAGNETTYATDNAISHDGAESFKIVGSANANQGGKYTFTATSGTAYVFSIWATVGSGGTPFATFDLGS